MHPKQAAEYREREAETTFAAGNGRTIAWLSREFVRALGAIDLSPPQYRILILLSDGSAMSSSLATRLAVSPPSITSVVDGLVNRGLVERHHGGDDRRRVALVLTEEGLAALARADHQMDAMASDLAANLGDPDLAGRALDGLQLWSDALVARHMARRAEPQKTEAHMSEALKSEAQPTDVPR